MIGFILRFQSASERPCTYQEATLCWGIPNLETFPYRNPKLDENVELSACHWDSSGKHPLVDRPADQTQLTLTENHESTAFHGAGPFPVQALPAKAYMGLN